MVARQRFSSGIGRSGWGKSLDVIGWLVVWGGLRVSVAPADERHPYGYGKAEALSGIVASRALLAAAAMIAVQSVREILTPHHLPHWSTLLVLVLVVATKAILARWMGGIGEEADSTSLQADAWHHWADALTSIAARRDRGHAPGSLRSGAAPTGI